MSRSRSGRTRRAGASSEMSGSSESLATCQRVADLDRERFDVRSKQCPADDGECQSACLCRDVDGLLRAPPIADPHGVRHHDLSVAFQLQSMERRLNQRAPAPMALALRRQKAAPQQSSGTLQSVRFDELVMTRSRGPLPRGPDASRETPAVRRARTARCHREPWRDPPETREGHSRFDDEGSTRNVRNEADT